MCGPALFRGYTRLHKATSPGRGMMWEGRRAEQEERNGPVEEGAMIIDLTQGSPNRVSVDSEMIQMRKGQAGRRSARCLLQSESQ